MLVLPSPSHFCHQQAHHHAGDASDHSVQVGKQKAAQRAAVIAYRGAHFFDVSFVASMVSHNMNKYTVSFSSVLSLGPVVFHGTLGTTNAVMHFVHRATV